MSVSHGGESRAASDTHQSIIIAGLKNSRDSTTGPTGLFRLSVSGMGTPTINTLEYLKLLYVCIQRARTVVCISKVIHSIHSTHVMYACNMYVCM